MKTARYRGFVIESVTDDKYTLKQATGGQLAPTVSMLQAVHSIDHYLDRSCATHSDRSCPGQFRAGSKIDAIILDEIKGFRLTDV